MAYRLKKNESIPAGIKRLALEEIDSAGAQLAKADHRDEAIHEARKSIKKVRGIMRLVQPQLGRVYQRDNTQIGDVGRELSELRDGAAMIEVFDALVQRYKDSLREDALLSIRRGLEKSKQETEQAINVDAAVRRAIAALHSLRKEVKEWPLELDGFEALQPGLKQRYRRGRQAMAVAEKDQTPESYHEWRKRVKDHWYHVRLLENAWTEALQAREASLKSLETWLGDDHNLAVLSERIKQNPESFGAANDVHLFCALSAQYQKELRDNALSLGERLYQEKAGQFVANMSSLWDAWHSQPESLKEADTEQEPKPGRQPPKPERAKAKKSAAA